MEKIREWLKSVRVKLLLTLSAVIIFIIVLLILVNNVILETFYIYAKTNTVKDVYNKINRYYNLQNSNVNLSSELQKIALKNNFDILIKTDENILVASTNSDFLETYEQIMSMNSIYGQDRRNIIYSQEKMVIRKIVDNKDNISYIMLMGELDNGYKLYIRIPIAAIEESVKISNNLLILIGGVAIVLAAIAASFISKKFTKPIVELNSIANRMAKLDFSQKYRITDTDDEINELGKSINTMSDKLERTIKQLRSTNIELEKDIEEKSKIDDMRKQFISDVSHELKTPIALIQGYAEGLVENVNTDEESKKFYAEVILDESNKMDRLVKQLLELMKLEYGKREFKNAVFDLNELIKEVVRKCNVMLEEKSVKVEFKADVPIEVEADEFYIDQIVTNYLTNAIKHVEEVEGEKKITIKTQIDYEKNRVRTYVFNTGETIEEEEIERIWGRFYKVDSSRNREAGGSGIGLALVKAIMNNYQSDYGAVNKENGVEFYFDLNLFNRKE